MGDDFFGSIVLPTMACVMIQDVLELLTADLCRLAREFAMDKLVEVWNDKIFILHEM